jgi:hypothetical protein
VRLPATNGRTALLIGVVLAALGLRVVVLVSSARLGADEAIPGLMARHIVTARELPVFFWGQAYFGAAESYLIAALFVLFGFQAWLLFVPALIASLALVPLTWALGEYLGPWPAGFLAALPIAFPPPVLSRMLGNAGGGFALAFALELGALLCVLWAQTTTSSKGRAIALFSLLAGLAWWVWQPALIALAPLLIVLLVDEPAPPLRWRLVRQLSPIALGLIPLLSYNVALGWPTVTALTTKFAEQRAAESNGPKSGIELAGQLLLIGFGGGEESIGGANSWQALLLVGAFVVQPPAIVFMAMRCSARVWRSRAFATGLVLVVALLNTLAAHGGARYLVPTSLAGYALCGAMLALLATRSRGGLLVSLGVCVLVFGVGNLRGYADIPRVMAPEQLSRIDETEAAVAALDERGLRMGYADYWTAYPIMYVSQERIVVAPTLPLDWGPGADRYPAYTRLVDAATQPTQLFVLVDRRCVADGYLSALDLVGATYRVDAVARWLLIWDIAAPVGAESATLDSLRHAVSSQQRC